jgi:FixJ family two-component response regulator
MEDRMTRTTEEGLHPLHHIIERSKAIRAMDERVEKHFVEGLTVKQSAERLGVSVRTVKYIRARLQLTTGKAWRKGVKPMGRTLELKVKTP